MVDLQDQHKTSLDLHEKYRKLIKMKQKGIPTWLSRKRTASTDVRVTWGLHHPVGQEVNDLLNYTGPSKRKEKKIWRTLSKRRKRPEGLKRSSTEFKTSDVPVLHWEDHLYFKAQNIQKCMWMQMLLAIQAFKTQVRRPAQHSGMKGEGTTCHHKTVLKSQTIHKGPHMPLTQRKCLIKY